MHNPIKNSVKSAIRLIKTVSPHISKLGGKPNLPSSFAWPLNPDGVELDFLAQLYCPELPAGFGLPATGTIFVFYDCTKMPWKNDEYSRLYWKIIYTEDPLPKECRSRHVVRDASEDFKEFFLRTTRASGSYWKVEAEDVERNNHSQHKMFGYPNFIQSDDMAPGKILLLQLDSDDGDDGPGWMWKDDGMLYFWISPDDLAVNCFDRIELVFECY